MHQDTHDNLSVCHISSYWLHDTPHDAKDYNIMTYQIMYYIMSWNHIHVTLISGLKNQDIGVKKNQDILEKLSQ